MTIELDSLFDPNFKDMMAALRSVPIFAPCGREFLSQLVSFSGKAVSRQFEDGEPIVAQWSAHHSMVVLLDGSASLQLDGVVAATLEQGAVCGDHNMLGLSDLAEFGLIAKGNCRAGEISAEHLMTLIAHGGFPEDERYFKDLILQAPNIHLRGQLRNCCSLFSSLSQLSLEAVEISVHHRICCPGEKIMTQGEAGTDLFILLCGEVECLIDDKVVANFSQEEDEKRKRMNLGHEKSMENLQMLTTAKEIEDNSKSVSVFGEIGLLGFEEERSATVRCVTICFCAVVYQKIFVNIMAEHNEGLSFTNLAEFMKDRYDGELPGEPVADGEMDFKDKRESHLAELKCFSEMGCSESFLHFLSDSMEERVFLAGQKVVDEANHDDKSMYLLVKGTVLVMKDDCQLAELKDDGIFGEALMLGTAVKRSCSVVAKGLCRILVISLDVMINAMVQHPADRAKVMMIAFKNAESYGHDPEEIVIGSRVEVVVEVSVSCNKTQGVKPTVGFADASEVQEVQNSEAIKVGTQGTVKKIDEMGRHTIMFDGMKTLSMIDQVDMEDKVLEVEFVRNQREKQRKAGRKATESVSGEDHSGRETSKKLALPSVGKSRKSVAASSLAAPGTRQDARRGTVKNPGNDMWNQKQDAHKNLFQPTGPPSPQSNRHHAFNPGSNPEEYSEYRRKLERIVGRALRKTATFDLVTDEFISDLGRAATDRIYLPGECIIEEQKSGDSMFIMISGKATVFVDTVAKPQPRPEREKETMRTGHAARQSTMEHEQVDKRKRDASNTTTIGILEAGSISGEMCMLGVLQKRSATIQAESICCMWEISHDVAMPIIGRFPEMQASFLETIMAHMEYTVPALIDSLPLFNGFGRKFRMLLGLYCERRAHFSGSVIFTEATHGEGCFVLNVGRASLECKGTAIQNHSAGTIFNVMCMLGLVRTSICSLVAVQTCHIVMISRTSWMQALEQYPARQELTDLKAKEQRSYEQFKQLVHRLCNQRVPRALVTQALSIFAVTKNNETGSSDGELQRIILGWFRYIKRMKKAVKYAERKNKVFEGWVTKRRDILEKKALRKSGDPDAMDSPADSRFDGATTSIFSNSCTSTDFGGGISAGPSIFSSMGGSSFDAGDSIGNRSQKHEKLFSLYAPATSGGGSIAVAGSVLGPSSADGDGLSVGLREVLGLAPPSSARLGTPRSARMPLGTLRTPTMRGDVGSSEGSRPLFEGDRSVGRTPRKTATFQPFVAADFSTGMGSFMLPSLSGFQRPMLAGLGGYKQQPPPLQLPFSAGFRKDDAALLDPQDLWQAMS